VPFSQPLPAQAPDTATAQDIDLGNLPEWNLSDLYPAIGSPELEKDLELSTKEAEEFASTYRGKLNSPETLFTAIKQFEVLQDRLGRIGSFAGLSYASNTTDPVRAKFYGDMNEQITAISSNLLFFGLELNTIEDDIMNYSTKNLSQVAVLLIDCLTRQWPACALTLAARHLLLNKRSIF